MRIEQTHWILLVIRSFQQKTTPFATLFTLIMPTFDGIIFCPIGVRRVAHFS